MLPIVHQALERLGEPKRIERGRCEARYEAVHGVIETGCLVADHARGPADARLGGLRRNGHGETPYGRDRLTEFIGQLVRDQMPLLLDALLDEQCELAALLETGTRFVR